MANKTFTPTTMRTALVLLFGLLSSAVWAGATWIGNSYININGTWYNGSGTESWATGGAFNGANLGEIKSLTIGAQIQVYAGGENWGIEAVCPMHYRVAEVDDTDNNEWVEHTLSKYDYANNNMIYQSGGSNFTSTTIDLSNLSPGKYTLSVYFGPLDGCYDSNNSENYVATFTVPEKYSVQATSYFDSEYNTMVEIQADERQHYAGDLVTLTVTLAEGIVLESISAMTFPTFDYESGSSTPGTKIELTKVEDTNQYTFTMPAAPVVVTATYYKGGGQYAINFDITDEHVTATAYINMVPVHSANEGDEVSLRFSSEDGKVETNITVTDGNNQSVEVIEPTSMQVLEYTFTMPASNVTVTAEFKYGIGLFGQSGGTINATVNRVETNVADAGETVILTPQPNQGYELTNLAVYKVDMATQSLQPVDLKENADGTYSFTMPASAVQVMPEFAIPLSDGGDNSELLATLLQGNRNFSMMLKGRTLYGNGQWNTICLPFNIIENDLIDPPYGRSSLAGATVMELDAANSSFDVTTGELILNFKTPETELIDGNDVVMKAGTPYIVKWDSGDDIVNPRFGAEVTVTEPSSVTSGDGKVVFQGVFEPAPLTANTSANLYLGAENKLWYPTVSDFKVNAFRAYFTVDLSSDVATSEEQQGVRSIRLNFGEGEQTAIYTPLSIRSGAEDEVLYTLDGRRLSSRPTAPGIYVSRSADGRQQGKGGRKVIIR